MMIDKNDPRLTRYVLGELPEKDTAEIENAIHDSPELAAVVEEIRQTVGLLGDAYAEEQSLSLHDDQKVELPATAKKTNSRWRRFALAASLAGAVACGFFAYSNKLGYERLANNVAESDLQNGWTSHTPANDGESVDLRGGMDMVGELDRRAEFSAEEIIEQLNRRVNQSGTQEIEIGPLRGHSILEDDSGGMDINDKNLFQGVVGGQEMGGADQQASMGMGGFNPRPANSSSRPAEFLSGGEIPVLVDLGHADEQGRLPRTMHLDAADFEDLLHLIQETISDGDGQEIKSFPVNLKLIVKQSQSVVEEDSPTLLETEALATHDRQIESQKGKADELEELELKYNQQLARLGSGHPVLENLRAQLDLLKQKLAADAKKSAPAKPKSWKRVKAIPNTTRLMVGDKEELDLRGMQANVQVNGFRARVLIDYFYYNDRDQPLEGNFKLRLPDDASLYYFAFGESAYDLSTDGKLAAEEFSDDREFVSLEADDIKVARQGRWDNVKESRMVPREKAAHAFRETVRRRVDPALVEWSGAGVFNAKVFPLSPQKLHRIVVGYDVNLTRSGNDLTGDLTYEFTLPENVGQSQIELNVLDIEDANVAVLPAVDPIPSQVNGQPQKRFVFEDVKAESIRLTVKDANDVLLQSSDDGGEFWTVQVTPDLPVEQTAGRERAIFLVDTSLSSSPDKFNVWVELLQATLNNNRDSLKEFAVLFFNVDGHFWKEAYVANTPENVSALREAMDSIALEGATDLYSAIDRLGETEWIATDEANSADVFLLSDGGATWGETNLRLIDRRLGESKLGSLFAYQTGMSGTSISGLRFLAGQSGGAVFSVATEDEIASASKAYRNRPWQLQSVAAAGASDILTAGRIQWVYPGQTISVVGRGQVDDRLELTFAKGEATESISLVPQTIESDLASRMYGQVAVGQLESLGADVFDVSAAYARHFRVTGQTCSLLMLESAADYERFDIKPQEDLFVIKTKAASALVEDTLMKSQQQLADPKAQLLSWLQRLESMPGMQFEMPTALKLALDDIDVTAISSSLDCNLTTKAELSPVYLNAIGAENPDYDQVSAEARRRGATSVDDAIKVYSSLVERNPGDITIARDVAFTALQMDRPAAAYHLLKRVALQRPFQGNIYPAIGQCLANLGKADMAIVYYEIAINGSFQRQGDNFKQIVSVQYLHLLRQIVSGEMESSVPDFARARLETLEKNLPFGSADVIVTMMWNQDQTDVDLHVIEPSGEECSYNNVRTRSDGRITSDIRTGFGPEMYFNANAPKGKYLVKAKFFSSGQNRTGLKNKLYLTILRGFGTDRETLTQRTVELSSVGEVEPVMTIGVE